MGAGERCAGGGPKGLVIKASAGAVDLVVAAATRDGGSCAGNVASVEVREVGIINTWQILRISGRMVCARFTPYYLHNCILLVPESRLKF